MTWTRNVHQMRRLLFDTNGIDSIATPDGLCDALRIALASGDVEILVTHVQLDELVVMADKNASDDQRARRGQRIATLNSLPNVRHIPTAGFVIGIPRASAPLASTTVNSRRRSPAGPRSRKRPAI